MIIDTNGFEIGDEVWCLSFETLNNVYPVKFKISAFLVTKLGIMAKETYGLAEGVMVNSLYHSKQECQLECDRLNGEYHD